MKAADLERTVCSSPAVIGGTVTVVNVDGIEPGKLKLIGHRALADIFLNRSGVGRQRIKGTEPRPGSYFGRHRCSRSDGSGDRLDQHLSKSRLTEVASR